MSKIHKNWVLLIILVSVVIGGLTLSYFLFIQKDSNPIPSRIRHQVNFTIMDAQSNSNWRILPTSVAYNSNGGILSMTIMSGTTNMSVNEQAQPEVFAYSSQVYPALLNKLNQYADLQTAIGTVTLTHPKELNGGQTAVINDRQSLIFVKPSTNLNNNQWKDFFAAMQWD